MQAIIIITVNIIYGSISLNRLSSLEAETMSHYICYPQSPALCQAQLNCRVNTHWMNQSINEWCISWSCHCRKGLTLHLGGCCQVTSIVSNSVRPHRRQPTRLHHPWDSPGKNTGVCCQFLLQCMKVKSKREVAQSCPTLRDPMDCSPPGPPIPGILQARTLE